MNTRHRWGERKEISPHKTEYTCGRCGMVKVSRHEFEGGFPIHWKEFWRDLDRVAGAGDLTPPCDARLEVPA